MRRNQPSFQATQIIESDAGSCCSIVARLIENTGLLDGPNGAQIATALAYGIKTDTDNLESARSKDWDAMKHLSRFYKKDDLRQISTDKMTTQTAAILKKALAAEQQEQSWLYSGVGFIQETYRDSIASVADVLMKRQAIDCVLVYAIIEREDGLVVEGSIRSTDASFDIETFVKNFSQDSGGRKYKGGFCIPLGFWGTCPDRKMIEEYVSKTIIAKINEILGTTKTSKDKI